MHPGSMREYHSFDPIPVGREEHALREEKCVFCKQLPEMGAAYITKVVFDPHHSTIIIKRRGGVWGGICFRTFSQKGFVEIVFCAITHELRFKGYGMRLMNHMKEYCRFRSHFHLLTCADNNAIGFFRKAGFTNVTLPPESYAGYIKDYSHTTLMECVLSPDFNNLTLLQTIKHQRGMVYRKMQEVTKRPILFHNTHQHSGEDAVLKSLNWKPPSQEVLQALHKKFESILHTIAQHPASALCTEPLPPSQTHLLEPTDMTDYQTVQTRMRSRAYYLTKAIFKADLDRMVANRQAHYGDGSPQGQQLEDLKSVLASLLSNFDTPALATSTPP
eukprot:NODE_2491_length_1163_cov_26.845560_g2374_i0.p1 GENE.NODE_2491_length_1163_cov_26.845560_g2374_i0~~NODE_2491_length_1163_cov_26.845560_g2374_i0.p1  ORF type:complete len:331 (+),score=94.45 NODE_2491_length_1163_cov_26.845560_g2374_i0:89-1081(+)